MGQNKRNEKRIKTEGKRDRRREMRQRRGTAENGKKG